MAADNESTVAYQYAGFWLRFLAAIVDTLILWVPGSAFRWLIGDVISGLMLEILDFAQLTLIWALYYGVTESSERQATFGKRLVGIYVIDADGQRLTFGKAAIRFLLGVAAALPLGIGLFMIGWTERKQGLHDMIARCLVVRNSEGDSDAT